jgi:hypothetical protein
VELLLKHGGRIDVEARMCWPGPHNQNCEERFKNCKTNNNYNIIFLCYFTGLISFIDIFICAVLRAAVPDESLADRSSDKLQSAIYYGIDGDQVAISSPLLRFYLSRIR